MKVKFSAIVGSDAALKAVESDGYALQYVRDQTEAVCLKAVESNGDALKYVLDRKLFTAIAAKFGIEIEK